MNADELRTAAEHAVDCRRPGERVTCMARRTDTVGATAAGKTLTRLTSARSVRVTVRVRAGDRSGAAVVTSPGPDTVRRAVERARGLARITAPGDPVPADVAVPPPPKSGTAAAVPVDPDQVARLAAALHVAAVTTVRSVRQARDAAVGHGATLTALRDSDGAAFEDSREEWQASCTAVARDGGDMAVHYTRLGGRRLTDGDVRALGGEAAADAHGRLGARPLPARLESVLLSPWALTVLIGRLAPAFVDTASGTRPAQRWPWLDTAATPGRAVLVDDGLLDGSPGTRIADDEGTVPTWTELASPGGIIGGLRDRAVAAVTGRPATGNAHSTKTGRISVEPTTLRLAVDEAAWPELLARAGDGCYVQAVGDYRNGVDPASGTVSVTVSGRVVRGGELAEAFTDAVLACSAAALLGGVTAADGTRRFIRADALCHASATLVEGVRIEGVTT